MGVLDDDRDELARVPWSELDPLAGDHDPAVGMDFPLGLKGSGRQRWRREPCGGLTGAVQRGKLCRGDRAGPGLDERVVDDGVHEVTVEAEREAAPGVGEPDQVLGPVEGDLPVRIRRTEPPADEDRYAG